MSDDERLQRQKKRTKKIVLAYPLVLIAVSIILNVAVFGVRPIVVALPSVEIVGALVLAAGLLVINHTWLMTTTELTRLRFDLHATPEERAAGDIEDSRASEEGIRELERRHNTHRNTTENVVYYVLLAMVFSLTSPPAAPALVWLVGYAIARLGYTQSYLRRSTDARGLFMSLSLLALYGLASYLVIALFAG